MTEVTTGFAKSHAIERRAGLQPLCFRDRSHHVEDHPGPLFVHDRKVVVGAARIRGLLVHPAVLAGQQATGKRTPYEQADLFRLQQGNDFPFEIAAGIQECTAPLSTYWPFALLPLRMGADVSQPNARLAPRRDRTNARSDRNQSEGGAGKADHSWYPPSMARLWRDQGRRNATRDLLAPVYGWFTEGFDMLDLKEAKVLLGELAY
jgi:hypothetical protein